MAIDKAVLTSYLDELGLSDTVRASVLSELESNPDKANKFTGQRLRHDDYTRKSQELATNKQTLEQQVQTQIQGYSSELQAAQLKIAKISQDFESERISRATAEARLNKVKTTYDLSDEDIPPVEHIAPAAAQGQSAVDINGILAEFRTKLLREFRQDLAAMPGVTATQFDIAAQHQETFGKRLTRDEMNELVTLAQRNSTNLTTAWEQKHNVQQVRTDKLVTDRVAEARQKWDDDARTAASNAAMSSVTSHRESTSFTGTGGRSNSPVLGRQYAGSGEETPAAAGNGNGSDGPAPPSGGDKSGTPKLSGAERAAHRWIEKANAGSIGKVLAA